MWDERLNTTIDEVAQQMTDGVPDHSAAFRRRVIARIEAGDTPRARWRPQFVVASVAAIVLALVMAKQAARLPPWPRGDSGTSNPETAGAGRPRQQPETSIATSPNEPAHIEIAGTTVRLPPLPRGFSGTRELDAPPIDPLDVAPLTVDVLRPDPIPVDRLDTIAPILVAPLDITDVPRRNP